MLQREKALDEIVKGAGFNGHPPLGVNATENNFYYRTRVIVFQWAPTLRGECYQVYPTGGDAHCRLFQWAPTLRGECYASSSENTRNPTKSVSMGTHP